MIQNKNVIGASLLTIIFVSVNSWAKGNGTSAGINLLQAPSARAASMGEAVSLESDDISAFNYNPASLNTLQSAQGTFLHNKGIADDNTNALSLGMPRKNGNVGFSLSYYNGGQVDAYDGVSTRMVAAKRDLALNFGYARIIKGYSLGVSGKYLSSEVAQTSKATAVAMDLGTIRDIHPCVRMGFALQNLGTPMKYDQVSYSLPTIARFSMSTRLTRDLYPIIFNYEVPYYFNEKMFYPSIGTEVKLGVLALRAGYTSRRDMGGLTFGTGFFWGNSSLDYSFNLINTLDSRHFFSFTYRFDAPSGSLKKKEEINFTESKPYMTVYEIDSKTRKGQYVIQPGDTLETIAYKVYGDKNLWRNIFFANSKIMKSTDIKNKVGLRIVIP